MAMLRAHYLQCCLRKAADGNNVLLKQPDDEDELFMLAEDVQNG
jgi:hypothetical protein